jgi:hypothetical protein
MELEKLPENILFEISKFADPQSRSNLKLTSKFFNDFIRKNPDFCMGYFKLRPNS